MRVLLLLMAASCCYSQSNTLSPEEATAGWVLLFDGTSLEGWVPEDGAQWHVVDGAIVGEGSAYGWLRSAAMYNNFELKCDFRTGLDGNSGIFLRAAAVGPPHLTGYEVQIFDKHAKFNTGSIVGLASAKGGKISGDWQSFEILANGPYFQVKLDGHTVLETRDGKSASGHIGFQYSKDKKVEFRNVKIRPLAPRR